LLLVTVLPSCARRAPVVDEAREAGTLPYTFERVWRRTGAERGFARLANAAGDLTLTTTGIEHATRKKKTSITWDEVLTVSFGKMKGDVDTDWVVLALTGEGKSRIVGFRDANAFGFGERTEELYDVVRGVARDLGVAQYDIPAGLTLYDAIHRQLVLGHPEGWHVTVREMIVVDGYPRFGSHVFTPEPLRSSADEGTPDVDEEALARVRSGALPAIVLVRAEAKDAMSCERGIKPKARAEVERLLREDPILGGVTTATGGAWAEVGPADAGGCRGLRYEIAGREDEAGAVALSRNGVLFVLGFRAPASDAGRTRALFADVVASVHMSAAR
jgi:hypothetical protein